MFGLLLIICCLDIFAECVVRPDVLCIVNYNIDMENKEPQMIEYEVQLVFMGVHTISMRKGFDVIEHQEK